METKCGDLSFVFRGYEHQYDVHEGMIGKLEAACTN